MNIENYVKLNESGELDIDKAAFQSALDAEISRAVDKYAKGKGRDEIRKQLEEEAKLTADEKLKAEKEEFEEYKKKETIKLNQEKAKAKLEGKGFSEKEIEYLLGNVGIDSEKSMKNINTLIEEREKLTADIKQKAIESLQQQQQQSGAKTLINADGEGEKTTVQKRSGAEVLSIYTNQQQVK